MRVKLQRIECDCQNKKKTSQIQSLLELWISAPYTASAVVHIISCTLPIRHHKVLNKVHWVWTTIHHVTRGSSSARILFILHYISSRQYTSYASRSDVGLKWPPGPLLRPLFQKKVLLPDSHDGKCLRVVICAAILKLLPKYEWIITSSLMVTGITCKESPTSQILSKKYLMLWLGPKMW